MTIPAQRLPPTYILNFISVPMDVAVMVEQTLSEYSHKSLADILIYASMSSSSAVADGKIISQAFVI